MGRPKTYTQPRVTTAVRLPEPLYRRLRDEADARDTSVNHLLVKAADYYLDRLPPVDIAEEKAS
jgi:predicted DNA-binding ribbon-helix-helix protein